MSWPTSKIASSTRSTTTPTAARSIATSANIARRSASSSTIGNAGILGSATGVRDPEGTNHALGGTFVARFSAVAARVAARHRPITSSASSCRATSTFAQLTQLVRRAAPDRARRLRQGRAGHARRRRRRLGDARRSSATSCSRVRKAGKNVFAYMVYGTGRDYFVASAADKIFVDPAGGLRLVGMAGESFYFRGLLDMVGVVPDVEKIARVQERAGRGHRARADADRREDARRRCSTRSTSNGSPRSPTAAT